MQFYAIIIAGGSGKRLWPLSQELPKQLLKIGDYTLIERTVARITAVIPAEKQIIVTTEQYAPLLKKLIDVRIKLIEEPVGCNTAPAIARGVWALAREHRHAVVAVIPADHMIEDVARFSSTLLQAAAYAQGMRKMVLLGIKPTCATTEYGYIAQGQKMTDKLCAVSKFHEKPDLERAQQYLAQGMLWNAGIFCAPVDLLMHEFRAHLPEVMHHIEHGTLPEACSIDHGIFEKSRELLVLESHFDWVDVGSVETFIKVKNRYESHI